jgi:hypothetical protein
MQGECIGCSNGPQQIETCCCCYPKNSTPPPSVPAISCKGHTDTACQVQQHSPCSTRTCCQTLQRLCWWLALCDACLPGNSHWAKVCWVRPLRSSATNSVCHAMPAQPTSAQSILKLRVAEMVSQRCCEGCHHLFGILDESIRWPGFCTTCADGKGETDLEGCTLCTLHFQLRANAMKVTTTPTFDTSLILLSRITAMGCSEPQLAEHTTLHQHCHICSHDAPVNAVRKGDKASANLMKHTPT